MEPKNRAMWRVWKQRTSHVHVNAKCIYWVYLTMIKICNSNNNYIHALKRWINGTLPVTTVVAVHCWISPPQPRTTELQYDCHDILSNQSQEPVLLWLLSLKPPWHTDQRPPQTYIIILDSLKAVYNLRLRSNTVIMIVWVWKVEWKQHWLKPRGHRFLSAASKLS